MRFCPSLTESLKKLAGLAQVLVEISPLKDEMEILTLLIHLNKQRIRTNEMMGREARVLIEVEADKAKRRKQDAGRAGGVKSGAARSRETKVPVNSPEPSFLYSSLPLT